MTEEEGSIAANIEFLPLQYLIQVVVAIHVVPVSKGIPVSIHPAAVGCHDRQIQCLLPGGHLRSKRNEKTALSIALLLSSVHLGSRPNGRNLLELSTLDF